jgi:hypothetical protein
MRRVGTVSANGVHIASVAGCEWFKVEANDGRPLEARRGRGPLREISEDGGMLVRIGVVFDVAKHFR